MILYVLILLVTLTQVKGFGDNPYYYDNWCGHYDLHYLDDVDCIKKFPSAFSRDWKCPNRFSDSGQGFSEDLPFQDVVVDTEGLKNMSATENVNMMVRKEFKHS